MIEDTDVTADDLRDAGFAESIVQDVLALTRHALGNETYRGFIERTIRDGSIDALRVKAADLQDNLTDIDEVSPGRKHEYGRALSDIRCAIAGRRDSFDEWQAFDK